MHLFVIKNKKQLMRYTFGYLWQYMFQFNAKI